MISKSKLSALSLSGLLGLVSIGVAEAVPVDIELSLVIDVSTSISLSEYNLQMDGYANAFRQTSVQNAITGRTNGIAVNAVFFASDATEGIGFTHLQTAADINAFANILDAFSRPLIGQTNIFKGMELATLLLLNNGFEGTSLIMDVSGDGIPSIASGGGSLTQAARDKAAANGITVNGLVIGTGVTGDAIFNFYRDNVITANGFELKTNDFTTFGEAVARKIEAEIPSIPNVSEPATSLLALLGLVPIAFARRL